MNLKEELNSIPLEGEKGKLEFIIERLKEYAKKGHNKATFDKSFYDKWTIQSLRAEGLTVTEIADWRDGDYIIISW